MKKFSLFAGVILITLTVCSKEGMWIPIFLEGVIMNDMKLNGFQLSAEDIYSINKESMKDAVVRFGGGCTGEMISSSGLLLTNHHCGYGQIQSHSSLKNDYLTNGFWAMNLKEELPNPGLSATFILRIEDVTEEYLAGTEGIVEKSRVDSILQSNSNRIIKSYTANSHFEGFIRSFFNGNQFILFITETFTDVRLVGAPPSSIGKFGFDTDNWVWPRHTGDFSIFRIYAGKDNLPAEYSEENIPYKPGYHFPISLEGYKEGDFTMVYGFPYQTNEYLTSDAVDFLVNVSNPKKIEIRTKKLDVLNERMMNSEEVRIKYAAKQSSTSNAWKKWIGQNRGLNRNQSINKKKEFENKLKQKIAVYPDSFAAFEGLQERLEESYKSINEVALARDYYIEIAYYGSDAMRLALSLKPFVEKTKKENLSKEDVLKLDKILKSYFKDYDAETDGSVFKAIMPIYLESEDNFYKPLCIKELKAKNSSNINEKLRDIYFNSIVCKESEMLESFKMSPGKTLKKLTKDELYILADELSVFYKEQITPAYNTLSMELDNLNKEYINLIRLAFPDQNYYPDANGTLRVSYGKIEGMSPADAVKYNYYTSLEGVLSKYDATSYEFNLPQRLIELYESKDYDIYAENGEMRVCFVASNHTSGGNSGSPVLNSKGELIGLNFDRNWEGTMSDINYDINQCRNISVDIRYVLFIVDKFAGAKNIINELTITGK